MIERGSNPANACSGFRSARKEPNMALVQLITKARRVDTLAVDEPSYAVGSTQLGRTCASLHLSSMLVADHVKQVIKDIRLNLEKVLQGITV